MFLFFLVALSVGAIQKFLILPNAPSYRELRFLKFEFAEQYNQSEYLIIGNSFARRMHDWLLNQSNPHFRDGINDSVLNLSLGGSTDYDWLQLLEMALRGEKRFRRVFLISNTFYNPAPIRRAVYFPFLLSFSDVLKLGAKKIVEIDDFMHLILAKILPSLALRSEIQYRLFFDFMPFYSDLSKVLDPIRAKISSGSGSEKIGINRFFNIRFEKMQKMAVENGIELYFVLTPLGPGTKNLNDFVVEHFKTICGLHKIKCIDYNKSFSLESFDMDQTHLTNIANEKFFKMILGELRK